MNTLPWLGVILLSAAPISELRGGIPLGIGLGFSPWTTLCLALVGNLTVIPILLWGLAWGERVFRRWRWSSCLMDAVFQHTRRKGKWIERFGALGLVLLVAVPLPGTGAWTGALAAFLFGVPRRRALPLIVLGVLIAAGLVTAGTLGFIHVFGLEST